MESQVASAMRSPNQTYKDNDAFLSPEPTGSGALGEAIEVTTIPQVAVPGDAFGVVNLKVREDRLRVARPAPGRANAGPEVSR